MRKLLVTPSDLGEIAVASADTVRILDEDVPLGHVVRIVSGLEVSAADAIDLQRKVDSGDYASLEVKLVARQDGGATNIIFLDHIPPEERAKYAHFIRK